MTATRNSASTNNNQFARVQPVTSREGEENSPKTRELLSTVADANEIIMMVDENAKIVFDPATTISNGSHLTPTGSYYDLLPHPEREMLAAILDEVRETRRQATCTVCVRPNPAAPSNNNNMPRWIDYKVVPFNPSLFMIARKDVSEAKVDEIFSFARDQLLESMVKQIPLEELLTKLITTVESIHPGISCFISIFDSTVTSIDRNIAPSLAQSFIQSIPTKIEDADIFPLSKEPVIRHDFATDPRYSFVLKHGFHKTSSHVIFSNSGVPLGTFVTCFRMPQELSAIEVRLGKCASTLAKIVITLKRDAEQAGKVFARSVESLSVTLDSIGDGVIKTDEDGKIVDINFAVMKLLGLDLQGHDDYDLSGWPSDDNTVSRSQPSQKNDILACYLGKPASSLLKVIQVFYPDSPTFQELPNTPACDVVDDPITHAPLSSISFASSSRPASWSSTSSDRSRCESVESSTSSMDSIEATTRYRAFHVDVENMVYRANEGRLDVTLRDSADRILAHPVENIDIHDRLRENIEHILNDGDINMGYLYRPLANPALLPVQVTVSPLRQPRWSTPSSGELKGSVIVIRDITEVIKARFANRQLANKSRWFSMLSHEMRMPVNGVIGMLELLRRTKLTPEQRSFVSCMEVSANALLCLVSNVLDKSRLDSGKVSLELVSFSVKDRLKSFCDLMAMMAKNRRVVFTSEIDDAIPDLLFSDVNRLFQILLNLVSNALKFSGGRKRREGHVQLRVSLLQKSTEDMLPSPTYESSSDSSQELQFDNTNPFEVSTSPSPFQPTSSVQLLFEVVDNGIGISPENIRKLFKEFGQAEASTSRRYGGSGMGLFICKQLVDLFGGEIGCESELGKGSRFYFTAWFRRGESVPPLNSPGTTDVRDFFSEESVQVLGGILNEPTNPQDAGGVDLDDDDDGDDDVSLNICDDGRPSMRKGQARILVADDDVINQQVVSKFLEGLGFKNVDVVGDGKQAIKKCRKKVYTFIMMDLFMPIMDGLETAAQITKEHRALVAAWPNITDKRPPNRPIIIAITGDIDIDVNRYRQCGVVSHLTKPIRMRLLMVELEKYVKFLDE